MSFWIDGLSTEERWARRILTGNQAPVVETRGYDAASNAIRTLPLAAAVTFDYRVGSRTGTGTITSWVPPDQKRLKLLVVSVSAAADATGALLAFQENTGTISSPVWTSRYEFYVPAEGTVLLPRPEQFVGPVGNGTGAVARLEVLAGSGTFRGTLEGFEV